ncbi:hypothetical protein BDV36DRAFT_278751 [Aspergillus pseudocaelatus]|uniref:Uncharacterized protein n=1 Tax=Aspergillus pseudocaelatus TaxID=1825620 RepID=A0ABQ6VYY3_9EURO|nr:hypothetical protein BDV36DRAFT_278751 [Aspergillus pseudocaelatus]
MKRYDMINGQGQYVVVIIVVSMYLSVFSFYFTGALAHSVILHNCANYSSRMQVAGMVP